MCRTIIRMMSPERCWYQTTLYKMHVLGIEKKKMTSTAINMDTDDAATPNLARSGF